MKMMGCHLKGQKIQNGCHYIVEMTDKNVLTFPQAMNFGKSYKHKNLATTTVNIITNVSAT